MNATHFPRSILFSAVSKGHNGGIFEIRRKRSEIGDRESIYQFITIIKTMQSKRNAHLD